MEGLPHDPVRGGRGGGRVAARGGGALSPSGRRIVLWRHGRTQWNADGRFQGRLDSPLDSEGIEDAALAAQVLASLPPTRLLTSSAGRARSTAAYLEKESGLVAEITDALQEINLGAWQGLTRGEARRQFPEEHAAWTRGEDVRRGGGETYAEVAARALPAVMEAFEELPSGGVLVAVAHGGTVRAVAGSLMGLDPDSWWRLAPLGNARWTVLLESDRGFRLAEHNAGVTEPVDRSRIAAPDVEPSSDDDDEPPMDV